MAAAERYIARMAAVIRPLMVTSGGPILLVQIENEYGSYGNDRTTWSGCRAVWELNGIAGPVLHRRRPDALHARGRAA